MEEDMMATSDANTKFKYSRNNLSAGLLFLGSLYIMFVLHSIILYIAFLLMFFMCLVENEKIKKDYPEFKKKGLSSDFKNLKNEIRDEIKNAESNEKMMEPVKKFKKGTIASFLYLICIGFLFTYALMVNIPIQDLFFYLCWFLFAIVYLIMFLRYYAIAKRAYKKRIANI